MAEFVKETVEGGVARVAMVRPDVHNAFNETVIAELTDAFRRLSEDEAVRVIVLAGAGRNFSAGADINWMRRMADYTFEENIADATEMAMMLRAIRECPRPTIARVHGATFGGGVGLIAACDMAVAERSATFCLSEVKLGILPAVISPYVTEKIGPGPMRRYALTAERFGAEEARRIGLISELVETPDDLDARVEDFVKLLQRNGPEAMMYCKLVLREIHAATWDQATDVTTRRIAQRRVSEEGQEGLRAFLEKRDPSWVGEE